MSWCKHAVWFFCVTFASLFCGVDVIRCYVMLSHVIALLSGRVNLLCSVIVLVVFRVTSLWHDTLFLSVVVLLDYVFPLYFVVSSCYFTLLLCVILLCPVSCIICPDVVLLYYVVLSCYYAMSCFLYYVSWCCVTLLGRVVVLLCYVLFLVLCVLMSCYTAMSWLF